MRTESVVVGEVVTVLGHARRTYLHQPEPERIGPLTYLARPPEFRRRHFAIAATEIRTVQRGWIGIDAHHDRDRLLGNVVHLELTPAGALWAIGTLFREPPEGRSTSRPSGPSGGTGPTCCSTGSP